MEMTDTAWKYLALIILSTRLHSPVLDSNSRISSRYQLSAPPSDVKLNRQFSDNSHCYLLPVIITLWSMFAPRRAMRGVGSSPE